MAAALCGLLLAAAAPVSAAAVREDRYVQVAVMQLTAAPFSSRFASLRAALHRLMNSSFDFVVVPGGWAGEVLNDTAVCGEYSAVAREFSAAVMGTWMSGNETHAALFDSAGVRVADYHKEVGTPERPTVGRPLPVEVTLRDGVNVSVGMILDTDYSFMEPVRSLMVWDAELVLHAGTFAQDANSTSAFFWLSMDNQMHIVSATYAEEGGSLGLPTSQGNMQQCYWSQGAAPAPSAKEFPCMVAGVGESVLRYNFSLTEVHRSRRMGGFKQAERSRRPFAYQPLCYSDARSDRLIPPDTSTSLATTVRVSVLQMAAERVKDGSPVSAQLSKAERYVRQAASDGADVAVLPEQWSVGYMTNFKTRHYRDMDSTAVAYDSFMKWATPRSGDYISHFRSLAAELRIAIAAAYVEQQVSADGERLPPRNSVVLISKTGEVLYNFAKVHLAWAGRPVADCEGFTTEGHTFFAAKLDLLDGRGNVTVCSFICYDREHPEAARLCQAAGAEIILMPTACGIDSASVDLVSVRAASNAVAVAMANYGTAPGRNSTVPAAGVAGTYYCRGDDCNGRSMVADHTGRVLVLAPGDPRMPDAGAEGVYTGDIDVGALRKFRQTERGRAFTQPLLRPELCKLPISKDYATPHCDAHRMWL
eukprot:TRINITY_DN7521_c3_g1_i2.p1 TRINITY_DN7521_c3_g1~~TRINITY_DN7521_c3_g1_i2.p1  ORF type:complete len:647 (+),score=92.67 TRINITY_DN7521_c3_g1_i2:154-2094(+)